MPGLPSFLPFGRRRPSVRVILGGLGKLSMSIEASAGRIEAQNRIIAQGMILVLKNQGSLAATQKAQGEAIQALAAASPTSIDTTVLDASINETDTLVADLASLVESAQKPSSVTANGDVPAAAETAGRPTDAGSGKPVAAAETEQAAVETSATGAANVAPTGSGTGPSEPAPDHPALLGS